jgi:hypothetical protein
LGAIAKTGYWQACSTGEGAGVHCTVWNEEGTDFGIRLEDALLVKKNCWRYEGEYRWIASNAMGRVSPGKKFITIDYDPQWIKAIIFGCRMPADTKRYIRKNIPFGADFKQAIGGIDEIEIVPFDENLHL